MILATLASLVILAVTAAPGRVFERRADERAPRHFRSSFAEYIELVMIGSATSLFAVLVVVLFAGAIGQFDLGEFFKGPGDYVKSEPWRIVGCGFVAAVLSFVFADLAARILNPKSKKPDQSAYRQHTIWFDSFEKERPKDKTVSVAIELSDGVQLSGILRAFSPTESDDRELKLQPFTIRRPGQAVTEFPEDQFLVLRESQVRYLAGEYSGLAK